jgi:hypothetical protein
MVRSWKSLGNGLRSYAANTAYCTCSCLQLWLLPFAFFAKLLEVKDNGQTDFLQPSYEQFVVFEIAHE